MTRETECPVCHETHEIQMDVEYLEYFGAKVPRHIPILTPCPYCGYDAEQYTPEEWLVELGGEYDD